MHVAMILYAGYGNHGATMRSEGCVALQKFHSVVRYIVLTNMCLDWMSITSSGSESYLLKMYTDFSNLGV